MQDTTTAERARRLTGCPWPTGIHRFHLGTCSRCGAEDPYKAPAGFTDSDDKPIPYVPAEDLEPEERGAYLRPEESDPNLEARVVAQVAVEYIVNHGADGFDPGTMRVVLDQAVAHGVAAFYTDMLADILAEVMSLETHHPETMTRPNPTAEDVAFYDALPDLVPTDIDHVDPVDLTGEPHQFHDGEPCFPGCPAWDGKR